MNNDLKREYNRYKWEPETNVSKRPDYYLDLWRLLSWSLLDNDPMKRWFK